MFMGTNVLCMGSGALIMAKVPKINDEGGGEGCLALYIVHYSMVQRFETREGANWL